MESWGVYNVFREKRTKKDDVVAAAADDVVSVVVVVISVFSSSDNLIRYCLCFVFSEMQENIRYTHHLHRPR